MDQLKRILRQPKALTAIYAVVWTVCLADWMWAQKLTLGFDIGDIRIHVIYWLVFLPSLPITVAWIRWSNHPDRQNSLLTSAVFSVCYIFWWQLGVFVTNALDFDVLRTHLARAGTGGFFFIGLCWVVWAVDGASYRYERNRQPTDQPDLGKDFGRLLFLAIVFLPAVLLWARRRPRPIRVAAVPVVFIGTWAWLTFLIYPGYLVGSSFFTAQAVNERLAWLPANAEAIVSMRPTELWNASLLRDVTDQPEWEESLATLIEKTGVDPGEHVDNIDTILVAATGVSSFQPDNMVAVIRSRTLFDVAAIESHFEILSHHGHTWYRLRDSETGWKPSAIYLPNSQTLVVGSEENIIAAIDQQDHPPRRPRFSFLDFSPQLMLAFDPLNRSILRRLNSIPYLRETAVFFKITDSLQNNVETFAAGISVDENIAISFQVDCTGSRSASYLESNLNRLISQSRNLFQTLREELEHPEEDEADESSLGETSVDNVDQSAETTNANDLPAEPSVNLPNFPGEKKSPDTAKKKSAPKETSELERVLADKKPTTANNAKAVDWSAQLNQKAAGEEGEEDDTAARIETFKLLEQIVETVTVSREGPEVSLTLSLPASSAMQLGEFLKAVLGEEFFEKMDALFDPETAAEKETADQENKDDSTEKEADSKEAAKPEEQVAETPESRQQTATQPVTATTSGFAILRELGDSYGDSLVDYALPSSFLIALIALLIAVGIWRLWQTERRLWQRRQPMSKKAADDLPQHPDWWIDTAADDQYVWNPLDTEAWYYGRRSQKLNQSLTALLSYSFVFLLAFLLFTQVGGCQEMYEMPAGGGEQKTIAQTVKIQKIIKKKYVVNPFSAIKFKVPPIDDVKLQLTEITKHAYTVGYGQGTGAGFAGGTKRGKVRFIRLEYLGGDWDQDFGVGADLNMLIEYGIRTKHNVAERTESRTIGQIKNFALGKSPPIVYMTGQKNIVLSKNEVKTLREYLIEKHGMIFGDNGGSSHFHNQFLAMMRRILPNVRPVPIALDDIIHRVPFQIPFLPYVAPHGGKDALGWKVDGRWVCYYHPGDIGDAWTDDHSGVSPEIFEACYQLGTNVFFYAHAEYSKWLQSRIQNK